MGDFLSPKQIAKKLKSRGYGKPHLYCQICRKQCRDDNGFKCHLETAKHIARMQQFEERKDEFIDKFSNEFEKGMMNIIMTVFKNQTVPITTVAHYYARARSQVRLNGTRWETLDDFAAHLGKTGQVQATETKHGFEVLYLEKDPEVLAKQERMLKERQLAKREDDHIEMMARIQASRERELKELGADIVEKPSEVNLDQVKGFKLSIKPLISNNNNNSTTTTTTSKPILNIDNNNKTEDDNHNIQSITEFTTSDSTSKKRKNDDQNGNSNSTMDSNNNNNNAEKKGKTESRSQGWLIPGIIVKIMDKQLQNGKIYKQKGVIEQVDDDSRSGTVKLSIPEQTSIKIRQNQLETVIPQKGHQVMFVRGKLRGKLGVMKDIDEKKFSVQIQALDSGDLTWESYDNVSKVSQ